MLHVAVKTLSLKYSNILKFLPSCTLKASWEHLLLQPSRSISKRAFKMIENMAAKIPDLKLLPAQVCTWAATTIKTVHLLCGGAYTNVAQLTSYQSGIHLLACKSTGVAQDPRSLLMSLPCRSLCSPLSHSSAFCRRGPLGTTQHRSDHLETVTDGRWGSKSQVPGASSHTAVINMWGGVGFVTASAMLVYVAQWRAQAHSRRSQLQLPERKSNWKTKIDGIFAFRLRSLHCTCNALRHQRQSILFFY